jgi:transposase
MKKQQENTPQTIEKLQEKILLLEQALAEKESTINKISADNNELRFRIDELKRLIYGSKRERFEPTRDVHQLNLEFEPKAAEIDEEVKAEREVIRISYERQKSKKEHQGRLALPSHLPVVETVVEPSEDTTGMIRIGEEITEELDYTPGKLHINRIIRPKYITREDASGNQKQVIAELNRPIPKCIASAALLTSIFTDKYIYHLPLYRIIKRINQMGVSLPSSTLESWVKLGAELIRPLYAVHRLYVFREIYQMIDESPIKVQDKDKKGACHSGYMWVRYAPLSKASLFEYYPSRSTQKGPVDDLHSFTGYIQTDGYSGYTYLASLKGITHLSCWAHARRYFEKALDNDNQRASHVLKLIQLLYAIEALAREAEMTPEQRHELRLEKSLPIINEIGQYIYKERDSVLPQSPIGKAFEYCSSRWTSLQNYLENGILEIDSNLVENAIRPLALGRKNYLFAGSHNAAKDIAMFYSFFATCTKNDIDPHNWLTYVINNINETKNSQLKNLLPQFIDKNLIS